MMLASVLKSAALPFALAMSSVGAFTPAPALAQAQTAQEDFTAGAHHRRPGLG
jgi:hypothetical protein